MRPREMFCLRADVVDLERCKRTRIIDAARVEHSIPFRDDARVERSVPSRDDLRVKLSVPFPLGVTRESPDCSRAPGSQATWARVAL